MLHCLLPSFVPGQSVIVILKNNRDSQLTTYQSAAVAVLNLFLSATSHISMILRSILIFPARSSLLHVTLKQLAMFGKLLFVLLRVVVEVLRVKVFCIKFCWTFVDLADPHVKGW